MPKPGHKRTDSTHSSNESEYTFSSEIAETEDIPLRTEVHFRHLSLKAGYDHAVIRSTFPLQNRPHLPIRVSSVLNYLFFISDLQVLE